MATSVFWIMDFSTWALITFILLAYSRVTAGQGCGDGLVEYPEQCDDNNTVSADGCSVNCSVEEHFECMNSPETSSMCTAILLDLNVDDNATLNNSLEYYDINTPVFFVDPTMLEFFLRPAVNWEYLDIVILDTGTTIAERTGLNYRSILSPPRPFMLDRYPSDYPSGVNGRDVSSGVRVLVEGSIPSLNLTDLNTTLQAVTYQANEHPGYEPQFVCLIAEDPNYATTACVTLYFIGRNSNPPSVSYDAENVVVFVEGQSEAVRIVVGDISVQDDDHPTRFLIESAMATIMDFTEGNDEWVSLDTSYNLPAGLNDTFDNVTGALTIIGKATTTLYSDVLQQLTYFNNMNQPDGFTRSVAVTVDDGLHSSNAISIQVDIMNTNDNPLISLNGEIPIITEYSTSYMEGTGAIAIVPSLHVVDTDPDPIIIRVTVVLLNPMDGEDEVIDIADNEVLNLVITTRHNLELSGTASPAVYTAALRTLTYHHSSANPGNPSLQDRLLEFTVEDAHNATSMTSILTLKIIPVNDAPMLSFLSGGSHESFLYNEDDSPINIGQNIALHDVDSPIMTLSLYMTNLLDGVQDHVDYTLGEVSTISVSSNDNRTSRQITFVGEASDMSYTEILRSLTYTNLHRNNSVTDGQRTIVISATDTGRSVSPTSLELFINVVERNDGPAINLGGGIDAGFTITYTENGPSVGIGLSHLVDVMDEEGHSISHMDIELVSTNGPLDGGDLLLLRTPVALPFVRDPNTVITNTSISISLPGENNNYTDALQSVRYINTEDEPTLYVNGTELKREIVIRITDATTVPAPTTNEVRVTVLIGPINDKPPRIIINSNPACTEDCRNSDMIGTISRRSTYPHMSTSRRRRRRSTSYGRNTESIAAPQILEVISSFIQTGNDSCLSEFIVVLNTDTNAPVVEVQKELDSLLTFAPASLANTPHYGYWSDYKTLVIVFRECVRWEARQNSKNPIYVVFYGKEGSCDWSSPCDTGVCYFNGTGCPVVGYYPVKKSTNHNNTDSQDMNVMYTTHLDPTCSIIMMSVVLTVAIVTVLVCQYKRGDHSPKNMVSNDEGSSLTTKPAIASHIIDISVPVVKKTPSNAPQTQLSERPSEAVPKKVLLLQKDQLVPPPPRDQGTDFILISVNTNTLKKIETLPRNPTPSQQRVSPLAAKRSMKEKDREKIGGVVPEGGARQQSRENCCELRLKGDADGVENMEGTAVDNMLRGDITYLAGLDGEASSQNGMQELQQSLHTTERGGVCRIQDHYDSKQSQEQSIPTHRSQQCNDSTQHPH